MVTSRSRDGTGFFFGNWETGRPVDVSPEWLLRGGWFTDRGIAAAIVAGDARAARIPAPHGGGADASAVVAHG